MPDQIPRPTPSFPNAEKVIAFGGTVVARYDAPNVELLGVLDRCRREQMTQRMAA